VCSTVSALLRSAAGVVLGAPDVPAFVSGVGCLAAFRENWTAGAEPDCFAPFAWMITQPVVVGLGITAVGALSLQLRG
jgi:hypothetical protein